MSASQLWSAQPQRAQNAAASPVRSHLIPGTWLQLSPTASPAVSGNTFLSLSPIGSALPSPALNATERSSPDDFALSGKFLTNNNGPISRASSFSSTCSVPRHPPLGQKTNHGLNLERRELAAGRAGGITSAFLANH